MKDLFHLLKITRVHCGKGNTQTTLGSIHISCPCPDSHSTQCGHREKEERWREESGRQLTLWHVFPTIDLSDQGPRLKPHSWWTQQVPTQSMKKEKYYYGEMAGKCTPCTHDSMSTNSCDSDEGEGLGSCPGPITLILILRYPCDQARERRYRR